MALDGLTPNHEEPARSPHYGQWMWPVAGYEVVQQFTDGLVQDSVARSDIREGLCRAVLNLKKLAKGSPALSHVVFEELRRWHEAFDLIVPSLVPRLAPLPHLGRERGTTWYQRVSEPAIHHVRPHVVGEGITGSAV
eukprot:CAMPEP_0171205358 /NCGR_PEP_ID=MMETSP0790-20130122/26508_1 /TAXON_ID=2925 /ORGANISM="Alexandrium catenella, Strain OF101" /LENGTH=136 /DNA_ID=CAMNT_0011670873 /DNA_START=60 /DNA_END=471 /DNA_ORIENTATION=-